MSYQDNFYKKKESNYYFKRVSSNQLLNKELRPSKVEILKLLKNKINLKNKKILEVGCFIGDLLYFLKKKYNCKVSGIEPSKLACKYAKETFKLKIENNTFAKSKKFPLSKKNFKSYDVIIIDDVLSWVDRNLILQTIASVDWLLKTDGFIFLRDFSPNLSFAVKNHHWKNEKIYNFKQAGGHKTFFINSGKYEIIYSKVYQTKKFNKAKSVNPQSNIWNDVILKKIKKFSFKVKKL